MTKRYLATMLALATSGLIVLACSASSSGASGGWSCAAKGKCPNDSPPMQADIDTCNQAIGDCCGDKYTARAKCMYDNEQCTGTGSMDLTATLQACATQDSDYTLCIMTCSGGGGGDAGAG